MDELTLIKTPTSYIKLGSKLTLLQQDAMLMVSGHLQQYVKNFFDLGLHRSGSPVRPLFTQYLLQNGIPPFKIYLADMGINAANYKVVREAVEEMNLLVEHQQVDADGKQTSTTVLSPVFKQFRVPPHYGYIEVEINNDVAQYAFDMAQGYIDHPKLIARYATKRSTPRLYFMLRQRHSALVRLTVQEIKNYLGFETTKDERTGEWIVPYAKFAHFKTKVLDAVQQDLDKMAEGGHTDITFTYEPIYQGDRRRGDPDFIEFYVKRVGEKTEEVIEQDLFAVPCTQQGLTKEQAQDAWDGCYLEFRDALGLTGADVWFFCYDETAKVVTFSYDRTATGIVDRLTTGKDAVVFADIVHRHFGTAVSIAWRQGA